MPEPFLVHRIDPVIGTLFGAHLWWYGLSYSLGFLNAHVFLRRHRARWRLSRRHVDSLMFCQGRSSGATASDGSEILETKVPDQC